MIESIDHEEQCGFHSQRGCPDGIFMVKMAINERSEHSLETWIMFRDLIFFLLVKAFDCLPREPLWKVLQIWGLSNHDSMAFVFISDLDRLGCMTF